MFFCSKLKLYRKKKGIKWEKKKKKEENKVKIICRGIIPFQKKNVELLIMTCCESLNEKGQIGPFKTRFPGEKKKGWGGTFMEQARSFIKKLP